MVINEKQLTEALKVKAAEIQQTIEERKRQEKEEATTAAEAKADKELADTEGAATDSCEPNFEEAKEETKQSDGLNSLVKQVGELNDKREHTLEKQGSLKSIT